MALSKELISEFVKVTKDNVETKQESTVYGTIVEYDGSKYVKLDGSDLLTPISVTTEAEPDERVTVLIKNHSATVTGNLSSPAVRTETVENAVADLDGKITEAEILIAKKVDADYVAAQVADLDNLKADKATVDNLEVTVKAEIEELEANDVKINGTLDAHKATIDSLEAGVAEVRDLSAKHATIENLEATNAEIRNLTADYGEFVELTAKNFEAANAEIDNLDAVKLSAENAEITYAKISELDAEKARIDELDADVAEIDTLIFGSASGNVIQTEFANAVIAQLGNAQIKSAMIENVSASKIVSGEIITNNVTVKSEDNNLSISDATIQISDDNRVRVQIGKDASDDYSINIWDQNGNLMFSKGGVSEHAIKDAIIRDDMVSDTANISASKLNISSLFEAINGSDKTINATKIMLDDQNQTLQVAFTSMTSDLDSLEDDVTQQGTSLNAIQGQISSKVWQTDIDTAVNIVDGRVTNLSEQYSDLSQEVDGISATVASHTTEISKKADATSVTEVSSKVSNLETNLSGFKTTVSETYAKKSDVEAADDALSKQYSSLEQTVNGISTTVSSHTTEISKKADTDDVSKTYATKEALNQVDGNVDTLQNGVDSLTVRMSDAETAISQNSDSIGMMVTKSEFTGIIGEEYYGPRVIEGQFAQGECIEGQGIRVVSEFTPTNITDTGRTSAKLTHCGKNLITYPYINTTYTADSGITFTDNGDGSITITGTATSVAYFNLCNYIDFGRMNMDTSGFGVDNGYVFSLAGTNFLNGIQLAYRGAVDDRGLFIRVLSGATVNTTVYPQVEVGTEVTEYEQYTGDSYTLDFGKTVYGGTIDWTTGEVYDRYGFIESYNGEELPGWWESESAMYVEGSDETPPIGEKVLYELEAFDIIQLDPCPLVAMAGLNTVYTNLNDGRIEFGHDSLANLGSASKYDLAHTQENLASLLVESDSIQAQVTSVEKTIAATSDSLHADILKINKQVEAKISSEDVQLQIESAIVNGVDKVVTTAGYTFDENGLTVSKSDTEMTTTISDAGMTVYKNGEKTLTATNQGVDAVNLSATTYLIIGNNSRFEDWNGRTACFWIGE